MIISSIIALGQAMHLNVIAEGQAMHLNVIAEGVENKLQAETLMDNGCELAQGFLYGKPMSADMVETWVLRNKATLQ